MSVIGDSDLELVATTTTSGPLRSDTGRVVIHVPVGEGSSAAAANADALAPTPLPLPSHLQFEVKEENNNYNGAAPAPTVVSFSPSAASAAVVVGTVPANRPVTTVAGTIAPAAAVNFAAESPKGGAVTPAAAAAAVALAARTAYTAELVRQKRVLPAVPTVTITLNDVSVVEKVPVTDRSYETFGTKLYDSATLAWLRPKKMAPFERVANVSGVIRPGTLTLVLAPPGGGKSTLLKTIAGRVAPTSGTIKYNGMTAAEAQAGVNGDDIVHVNKLVQYVDQVDAHNPLLTVKETFQFAVDNFAVDPSTLSDASTDPKIKADLKAIHDAKAENMIALLGLQEATNTVIGNAMVRGVSGGQRRRVTLGEVLLSEARVLALDEVTNGLDSSTALDIFRSLRTWAEVTGGSVVAALQQPTPEVYALFHETILLKEGHVVYSGASNKVIPYLESLGFTCPADTDFCDFMIEFLTSPRFVYALQKRRIASSNSLSSMAGAAGNDSKNNLLAVEGNAAAPIPFTTAELDAVFKKSEIAQKARDKIKAVDEGVSTTPSTSTARGNGAASTPKHGPRSILLNAYTRALYGGSTAHGFTYHLKSGLARQWEFTKRNKGFNYARIIQATFMSLILGSLFYQTPFDQFNNRIGLAMFTVTASAFGNMGEVPLVVESKRVLYKQSEAGMFPTAVYVISIILCHMPLLVVDSVIWAVIVYYMTGFTDDSNAFGVFLGIFLVHALSISIIVRLISYTAPNEESAAAITAPAFMLFMSFAGYLITADAIPDFMIWCFWLSPFSWTLRALAVNEFTQSRYTDYVDPNTGVAQDLSGLYLGSYQFKTDRLWIWAGALFLLGVSFVLACLSVYVLNGKRFELSRGTTRFEENDSADVPASSAAIEKDGASAALPFKSVTLSFKNIFYTVTLPNGQKRTLLTDVSGYAKPRTLTALMGVSGAGKTTLMDVIAGRKTVGKIVGDILVDGKKVSKSQFARMSGYVEQEDIHTPTATVRETLLFAAHLRLPESVAAATKEKVVDEVMELLELKELSDKLIGSAVILGLSPGQLKRVTIGVELVSNPAILFLDEPTTGLDSRSAYTVMRVIKKIAASGRSVVVTIHQPSAELFYMFDSLIMLAPGGVQTYFGSVGHRAHGLVTYFESLGAPRKSRRQNPASWMLDVIGAGTGANNVIGAGAGVGAGVTDGDAAVASSNAANAAAADVAIEIKEDASSKVIHVAPAPANTKGIDFGAAYAKSDLAAHCKDELARIDAAASASPLPAGAVAVSMVSPSGVVAAGAASPSGSGSGSEVSAAADAKRIAEEEEYQTHKYAASLYTQFYYFLIRIFRSYYRNTPFTWTRTVVIGGIGLMYGLIYFRIDTDSQGGVLSKAAAVILSAVIVGDMISFTSVPTMMDARTVFYRERASNTYASIVHSTSQFIVEIPWTFMSSCVVMVIFYWMAAFEADGTAWARYLFAHFISGLVYVAISQTIAAVSPNKIFAGLIAGIYPPLFFMFGSLLLSGDSIPNGWKWMWHITPLHFVFESLAMPQFESATNLITVVDGTTTSVMAARDFASLHLAFPFGNYWGPIGWLVLYLACHRVVATIATEKVSFIKR